ncbi:hypothetical protein FOCC_FOCC014502 [Frankliniella occidentalis]|nr:hypothetical protein FOCC_FOCC014502 [Frankliniella occidentalis]
MVGSMFPLPRVLFTMAADGMLVRSLALVSSRTGTSLRSTLLAWLMSSSMALLFNLEQLIDMMSIGTLTAYIMVAVSVVQIRSGRVRTTAREVHDRVLNKGTTCAIFTLSQHLYQYEPYDDVGLENLDQIWCLVADSVRHSTLAEIQRLERKPGSQDNLSTLSEGLAISTQQQLLNDSAGTELNNKN